MYCPTCGKEIPNHSKFCLHCGASVTNPSGSSNTPVEWEYKDFVRVWPKGNGGHYQIEGNGAYTEPQVRFVIWSQVQAEFLTALQKDLDEGWQPMTEVGPTDISFNRHPTGWTQFAWLEATEFSVKLRRPNRGGRNKTEAQPTPREDPLITKIKQVLERDGRLQAIKAYREATGEGLKESADFVDEVRRSMGRR